MRRAEKVSRTHVRVEVTYENQTVLTYVRTYVCRPFLAGKQFSFQSPLFAFASDIIMRLLILLLYWLTTVVSTTITSSYCGFPEGAPLQGTCAPNASNRQECETSYYFGPIQCYWSLHEHGKCTSEAVSTNEDPYCPTITDESTCDQAYFLGFRSCVWYETQAPTLTPSIVPSEMPSTEPSYSPSTAPSPYPTEYCGIPFLQDPWALPRQFCSDATNKVDCLRSFMETPIKCFWWNGKCTSELVDTGEDLICPIVGMRDVCNTVEHRLDRQCFWYEPRDPTMSPSIAPSAAPSASPTTPFPTKRPTRHPSRQPTRAQTERPQLRPLPTVAPVPIPTAPPTQSPSTLPTLGPSSSPSHVPTTIPSKAPTAQPSVHPTIKPSSDPSTSPSQAPSHHPSVSPSHSPTTSPSESPSSSPTVTPIEDLVTVCRCNRQTQCQEEPLEEGFPFYLCLGSGNENVVTLNSIESLKLQKNILEQLIARNATWVEGSFALQTDASLLVNINIRNAFFDEHLANTDQVHVDGQVRYSRTSGSSPEEGIYSFQLGIPVKNTDKVIKIVDNGQQDQDSIDEEAAEEVEKKRKFNIRLWTPIAVVLALLVLLSIKLVADFREGY